MAPKSIHFPKKRNQIVVVLSFPIVVCAQLPDGAILQNCFLLTDRIDLRIRLTIHVRLSEVL